MVASSYKKNIVVIGKKIDTDEAKKIIEEKKTGHFRSFLKKPDKKDIHVHSIVLNYESVLMISGRYKSNFYRKTTHTITVDHNVTEVVLGDGVFPIRNKSNWKKAISGKKGKNKIDLELEEHVFIDDEHTLFFDHHGVEVDFQYKMDPKNVEKYPAKILKDEKAVIKKTTLTDKEAIDLFGAKMGRPSGPEIRDLDEQITISEISEIYVPIYEARLAGPKKRVEILRLDAARNKIL